MLKGSPQLLQLLKVLELDLLRYSSQPGRRPEGPYADVLPFIVDQGQDWEAFAVAGQSAASNLVENTCFSSFSRSGF